jgi:Fur family transcriptional regulator, zinc uptake regulator
MLDKATHSPSLEREIALAGSAHDSRPHGHDRHHHDHEGSCRHALDRAQEARDALARAKAACEERGARLTPIRREVLEALYATHRPLGAYELIDRLSAGERKTLAPITVYRALDFLMEQGFVHRLASCNAFVACPHDHAPHDLVAFLICESCGGVDEMSSRPLSEALAGMLKAERFKARSQVLEISGVCGHCAEQEDGS